MEKIKYKDLSGWLKAVVILVFVYSGFFALAFLIGIIQAFLGVGY